MSRGVILAVTLFVSCGAALAQLTDVTQPFDPIIGSSTNSPGFEAVGSAIDNNAQTKYLNFDAADGTDVGFIVTPSIGLTRVFGLTMQSANDAPERDPRTFALDGSNAESTPAWEDNSAWERIAAFDQLSFSGRLEVQQFIFDTNFNPYRHYRWVVSEIAAPGIAVGMQVAEVELLGNSVSNAAPFLDSRADLELAPVLEDAPPPVGPAGTLISSLVDFSEPLGNVIDNDVGARAGIALVDAATSPGGIWHFSIDGTSWQPLGTVTAGAARLLAADQLTRLYYQPAPDENGTIDPAVTFRAWDRTMGLNGGIGDTSSNGVSTAYSAQTDTVRLEVFPVNDLPTMDPILDPAPINEDAGTQTLTLTGISAGGGEIQALRVTAQSDNPSVIPAPAVEYRSPAETGSLAYTPVAQASGLSVIAVTIQDAGLDGVLDTDDDGAIEQLFTITVNALNDPPTLDPIPDPVPVEEDTGPYSILSSGITAGGDENQVLSVIAESANLAVIPHPLVDYSSPSNTAILSYAPVTNASGSSIITVTIRDAGFDNTLGTSDDGTNVQTFAITVNPVNDPPTLNPIAAPAAIDEDTGPHTITLANITAGGGESQALSVIAQSSNPGVIPHPVVDYSSPSNTAILSYAPLTNASGSSAVTVTVRDAGLDNVLGTPDDGITNSPPFTITVNGVNDPPSFRIVDGDGEVLAGPFQLFANFLGEAQLRVLIDDVPDDEGTNVVYALRLAGSTNLFVVETNLFVGIRVDTGSGDVFLTSHPNQSGTNVFVLVANDGGTANANFEQEFEVEVSAEPGIVAGLVSHCLELPTDRLTNAVFTLFARGEEPLHYLWTVDGVPWEGLNEPALNILIEPGGPSSIIVGVIISNAISQTNLSATLELIEDGDGLAYDPRVIVTNGATTNLTAAIEPGMSTNDLEWRYNGIPLRERPPLIDIELTNNRVTLTLSNILAVLHPDPNSADFNQAGLYELVARDPAGIACTRITRFELEISSVTGTNAPHSVDNFNDLFGTNGLASALSSLQRATRSGIGLAQSAPPRAGTTISTIPRSSEFSYLDNFAASYQPNEADLFHTADRTNGLSRWYRLQAEDTNLNQLVTLNVSAERIETNTVVDAEAIVAVYAAPEELHETPTLKDLKLITRFDSYQDPTRPRAGGTNVLVSFETLGHKEFFVVIDTITNSAKVTLTWGVDPMPVDDQFQWLKLITPPRPGHVEVWENSATQQFYFAFSGTNDTYPSLARMHTDWSDWSTNLPLPRLIGLPGPVPAGQDIYLLITRVPGDEVELSLVVEPARRLGDFEFRFVEPTLRGAFNAESVSLFWTEDGVVLETAPSIGGPWRPVETLPHLRSIELPLDSSSGFYRLAPVNVLKSRARSSSGGP